MSSPIRPERPQTPLGFVPVFLANLIPLVGVLRLGWDPATLVVIYALELLFSLPLAGAKALFAQHRPRTDRDGATLVSVSSELTEKRGRVRPVSRLPPIYPRNLPFATAVVGAAGWFVLFVGVTLTGVFPVAEVIGRPEVTASLLTLIVGQSVETWRDYLHEGYETASPYTVIETPARQAFFLAFVLFAVPAIGADGAEVALGALVVVKLLVEWSAHRATRGDDGRLTGWLAGPDEDGADPDSVCIPDGGPDVRVPTDGRAALYTGAFHTLGRLAPFYAGSFAVVWVMSLLLLGGEEPSRTVAVGSGLVVCGLFVGFLAVNVGTFYLRYGRLEYRRYGDRLVAYDTLLDEPQWTAAVDVLRDVSVVPDRLPDRLLGTRTIAVRTGLDDGNSRRALGPVADPEALVDAFELPVRTTALEPIDRRPAAVVGTCLVGAIVAVVLLAVGPWMAPDELLSDALAYGVVGVPAAALALRLIWERAYPERSD